MNRVLTLLFLFPFLAFGQGRSFSSVSDDQVGLTKKIFEADTVIIFSYDEACFMSFELRYDLYKTNGGWNVQYLYKFFTPEEQKECQSSGILSDSQFQKLQNLILRSNLADEINPSGEGYQYTIVSRFGRIAFNEPQVAADGQGENIYTTINCKCKE